MRAVLTTLVLVVLGVAVPTAVATAQTTSEPAVAPSETVPPTEPAATDFTPPVDPGQSEVGDVAPSVSPAPTDGDDDGIGWVLPVVAIILLAAALGAARMLRRGPAGGDPGGATEDPYDPGV